MTSMSGPRLLDRLKSAASVAGFGEDWIEVARKAGVSDRTLRRWRKGENDDPRLSSLEAVAGALRTTIGQLLGESTPSVGPSAPFWAAPLLRMDVGAGEARLEMIPGAERQYGFRPDWLATKGWTPENSDRFGVYRLADLLAESMEPTISEGSILLVDREADPDEAPPRAVWIVRREMGLVCKRVTIRDSWMILESDNREERFAPTVLRVARSDRRKMLEGRVVWYATELA
jgi:transcriptional regulator with XRE-family HTH domain